MAHHFTLIACLALATFTPFFSSAFVHHPRYIFYHCWSYKLIRHSRCAGLNTLRPLSLVAASSQDGLARYVRTTTKPRSRLGSLLLRRFTTPRRTSRSHIPSVLSHRHRRRTLGLPASPVASTTASRLRRRARCTQALNVSVVTHTHSSTHLPRTTNAAAAPRSRCALGPWRWQ